MNLEISFAGKVCNFISLYRSPNQWHDIFEKFVDNLELKLDTIANKNSYLIVILGNFKAKSSNGIHTIKPLIKALKMKL